MPHVSVKKNAEKPESTEILAEAIIRIGQGFEKLKQSGVNERAILVLVADHSGVGKTEIRKVLDSLRQLRGYYCR